MLLFLQSTAAIIIVITESIWKELNNNLKTFPPLPTVLALGEPVWLGTYALRTPCEWMHLQRSASEQECQARREWLVISECLSRRKEETLRLLPDRTTQASWQYIITDVRDRDFTEPGKEPFPVYRHILVDHPFGWEHCQLNLQASILIKH